VGGDHAEGYRLRKRIHAGAFGEVWSAVAPGAVKVAVKILYRPVAQDEHQRRALDLIKNLNHPYLLKTQAYWVEDGRLHIAMELADTSLRERLRRYLRRRSGIPTDDLLVYLTESAEALDYVHAQGLLHRNIKPDNILLLKGHVKIGDFSQVCEDAAQRGVYGGAFGYTAPECYHGTARPQSDQYSLAISYVELRRGRRPFPARTSVDLAMTDTVEGSPDLGDLARAEKAVLLKALAKNPAERYPSCRDFAATVDEAVRSS
jgi:serine/threonine protein kinase